MQELSPAAKARILQELKKGDQARIAELVQVDPSYVKQVLRYRPRAKSVLAIRIWQTANRILNDRARLTAEMQQ